MHHLQLFLGVTTISLGLVHLAGARRARSRSIKKRLRKFVRNASRWLGPEGPLDIFHMSLACSYIAYGVIVLQS